MKQTIERLKKYIEYDMIYQAYKQGYEPSHNDGSGDFEWFCIEHCQDIEMLLNEYKKLKKELEDGERNNN